jgi:hypothetical protein
MSGYLGNAHGWATDKIIKHPSGVALTLAVLIVLVIILFITTMIYHSRASKSTKSGFSSPNGSWSGGMHSNWHKGGSIHDQNYFGPAFQHYAQLGNAWQPAVTSKNALRSAYKGKHHMQVAAHRAAVHRANAQRMKAKRLAAMHRREGQTVAPSSAMMPPDANGNCPAGYALDAASGMCWDMTPAGPLDPSTGYEGDEGGDWIFDPSACPSTGTFDANGVMMVDPQSISDVWDPDAIAEAQALASVGSYAHDPSGDEMAFQAAISSAYDANTAADTMSDAQLTAIMQGGTAP